MKNHRFKNESGFTLMEIMVSILIVGILSAIIIPFFLRQREEAVLASMKSDLRNAAEDVGSKFDKDGTYVDDLPAEVKTSESVSLSYDASEGTAYCLRATSPSTKTELYFNSKTGTIGEDKCQTGDAGGHTATGPVYSTAKWKKIFDGPNTYGAWIYPDGKIRVNGWAPAEGKVTDDEGKTWKNDDDWHRSDVAWAADGKHGVVVAGGGVAATPESTTDGGKTWELLPGAIRDRYMGADLSANGKTIVLAPQENGPLRISHDFGKTWFEADMVSSKVYVTNNANWYDVAVSADGQNMWAAPYFNDLLHSTDGGKTWARVKSPVFAGDAWNSLDMSSDGMTITASHSSKNGVYLSKDGGKTWSIPSFAKGTDWWLDTFVSPNGQYLVVAGEHAPWISSDGGVTWMEQTDLGNIRTNVDSIYMTNDGSKILLIGKDAVWLGTMK